MSAWISVKERLPPVGELVLLYFSQYTGTYTLGSYYTYPDDNGAQWAHDLDNPDTIPTHWQPLPDPPEDR